MEMNPKETGKRIQLLRKQRGLSQEELADKLNVSSNTIAKVECGLRRPSIYARCDSEQKRKAIEAACPNITKSDVPL